MAYRRTHTPDALLFTTVATHIGQFPTVYSFYKRGWNYEFFIAMCSVITSTMYHVCEAFRRPYFLTELQWHRLDNIASLCCFGMWFVYMSQVATPWTNATLKYLTLAVAILTQEKDPWNEAYTFGPIFLFFGVAGLLQFFRCTRNQCWPDYDTRMSMIGMSSLVVAVYFFVLGLDDGNYLYRMYHGTWHLTMGFASYFMWQMVRHPKNDVDLAVTKLKQQSNEKATS